MLILIQARLGSTRFPRKALASLHGEPIIRHVVRRAVQVATDFDQVVVATPPSDRDEIAEAVEVPVVAPDCADADVLSRFYLTQQLYRSHESIMRLTGDCPLLSLYETQRVVQAYCEYQPVSYVWNVAPGYVDGTDVEVFSAPVLQWAFEQARDPADREHVTPLIRRHVPYLTVPPETPSDLKTSIDTPEDLERVERLVQQAEWHVKG